MLRMLIVMSAVALVAGDCMYLPAYWYHHIVSTALPPAKGEPPLAIAVSFWYPVVHSATRLLKHWLHRDHERPNNLLDVACVFGDINGDGVFNYADRAAMNIALGVCDADINGDGEVNGADMAFILSWWGPCIP